MAQQQAKFKYRLGQNVRILIGSCRDVVREIEDRNTLQEDGQVRPIYLVFNGWYAESAIELVASQEHTRL